MTGDAPKPYDVVVLGGGITGLVAAWKLAEAGHRVVVADKSDTPGGMIKTVREDDWLLDVGPNSIGVREGDDVYQLINSLGLADELIVRPVRESDRYIWRRGQLRRVPVSPLQLFRKNALSRHMVTRAAFRMWQKHTLPDHDISVGVYFSTCLGRKIVDQVLAPAMAGIYAADPFSLSMQTVMPRLYQASRGHTSLVGALRKMKRENAAPAGPGGRRVMVNFTDGMETLPRAILDHARNAGAEFHQGFDAASVRKTASGHWNVTASDGREVTALHVLCSLPAAATADLLQDVAPDTADILGRIRYAPMVMAHIGTREDEVGVAAPGFGYLAVRDNGVRSLGMIWNDRMFPGRAPEGHRLFTVFLGGQIDHDACHFTDNQLLDLIQGDLRRTMKWTGKAPVLHRITRLPAAIPLMEVGHSERVNEARKHLPPGLMITGNYVAGVSVPSCMRAGVAIAESLNQADKSNPVSEGQAP